MCAYSAQPAGSPAAALASSPAYLLTRLGAESSRLYRQRLAPLGVEPHHARALRFIGSADGLSQQALADHLTLARSRIVVLVDELEQRNLVKRRPSPSDRRAYALRLTAKGEKLLQQVIGASREHEDQLCAPLNPNERAQLTAFLQRLVARSPAGDKYPEVGHQATTPATSKRAPHAA